jgi:hypothetical protein
MLLKVIVKSRIDFTTIESLSKPPQIHMDKGALAPSLRFQQAFKPL